ncbi:hypothetical protein [Lutibacter sp.]|uniref:hypothetical protein n=1 Tax=Lutibacter sp. TaxID=1925666 RepID=UPI00273486BD|nr:hypothetical protein [Lutibacter sp.]MDP3312114.1 hypothetical protein [Lutibacter sp.]
MLLSIFSNETFTHLIELLFWLIGAFLIGLYFGHAANPKKEESDPYNLESYDEAIVEVDESKIRATKTFERGGRESLKMENEFHLNEGLDFNYIGYADETTKNNLLEINGIGKKIESKLNSIGIFTFAQISNLRSSDIDKITELLKFFPGRIERDDWVGQAFQLIQQIEKK